MTDAFNEMTERDFGYPTFGYFKLFVTEEAATLLNDHVSYCSPSTEVSLKISLICSPNGDFSPLSFRTRDMEKIHGTYRCRGSVDQVK